MKQIMITLSVLLTSSLLVAGGNMPSSLPKVVPVIAQGEQKVYIDSEHALMWQDEAYADVEEGAYKNGNTFGKAGNHAHATLYCARLYYAGYSDWRLPTADELRDVHHPEGQSFKYFRADDFWSSTPATEGRYYVVFPADAYRFARNKGQSNYIRCVRHQ